MHNLDNLLSLIHDSKGKLFVLCGYPYAGKSYVADEILKHTDIEVVSIDNIFKKKGFDWDSDRLPNAEEWNEIFEESYERTKTALEQRTNVLYDSTNQTIASRDKLRELASSAGAQSTVIYIKTSIENVWKRWEENQQNPSRSIVSRELVQQTIDMFEEPLVSEGALIIEN